MTAQGVINTERDNAAGREIDTERHSVLDGKVTLHQDTSGSHRAGLDAVMLAASVSGDARHVVDLGAGVGSAGLCVAARLSHIKVTLVENNPVMIALAQQTLDDPDNAQFNERVSLLAADITLRGDERIHAGLITNMADCVIMNPPYWEGETVRPSPNDDRASAHILGEEGLAPWFRTASAILKSNGTLCVIFPAKRLDDLFDEMKGRFGDITLMPLYKGDNEEASRIIVRAKKASRAPMKIVPGLVLHEEKTKDATRREWTKRASAILKGEASLFI